MSVVLSRLKLNRQGHRVEAPVGSQARAQGEAHMKTAQGDTHSGRLGEGLVVSAAESHICTLVIWRRGSK